MSNTQIDSSGSKDSLVQKLLVYLENNHPDKFETWLKPFISEEKSTENTIIICGTSNELSYFRNNYLCYIEDYINDHAKNSKVEFKTTLVTSPRIKGSATQSRPTQARLPGLKPKSKAQFFRPDWTFDLFVEGPCNEESYSACYDSANGMLSENILFVDATTGLGKSHLVQALGHVAQDVQKQNVKCITANGFSGEMVKALTTNTMEEFKQRYRRLYDVLIIENIPALKTKPKTLAEFAEIVNHCIETGKTIITTSTIPLEELEQSSFDSQVLSMLGSGIVTSIKHPSILTKIGIVRQLSILKGVTIPEELIILIAKYNFRDIRKLERLINGICYSATRQGLDIVTEDMVMEKLTHVTSLSQKLNTVMIKGIVATEFKISEKALESRSRKKVIAFPRQVAMYLARKYTNETSEDIGNTFNRNHATVLHAVKVISNPTKDKTSIQGQLAMLENKLRKGGFIN